MSKSICSIEDCGKPVKGYGWCSTHYSRYRNWGSPHAFSPRRSLTAEQRFWKYVDASGDDCWEWTGFRDQDGYGKFQFEKLAWPASRWIYMHTHGEIPKGIVVRHKCDNPPCVRLEHLELGTTQDNAADRERRGRHSRGQGNGFSILKTQDVIDIKKRLASGEPQTTIAHLYRVTPGAICHIANGRSWTHVTI